MKTENTKMATLNPYRANAALHLAHIVRNGGKVDTATINVAASQCMKNATPGPMVQETIKAECTRLLETYKGKPLPAPAADVAHPEWNADSVLPLPKMGKDKAASKARKPARKLNK